MLAAGLLKLGTWIKYIPEPVVTGFTAGIAVIIAASQLSAFLGLELGETREPAAFMEKLPVFWDVRDTLNPWSVGLGLATLAAILLLRRFAPEAPGLLLAVGGAAAVTAGLDLPVATIGSRFGGAPQSFPAPALPDLSPARLVELLPSALTIAFLAGIESLLSAVVADGMTGRRHRSNAELVAQGVANLASPLFGGLPATGAIARTATNVRAGGRTPLAGVLHALFTLLFMLLAAPLAASVPLTALAAVLLVVAWGMADLHRFAYLLRAPPGDRVVLLLTFALTVLVDLTVAIQVGVVLAAILFMHRMAEVGAITSGVQLLPDDDAGSEDSGQRAALPPGVEVFRFRGPFFFGVAGRLRDLMEAGRTRPRAIVLRMREVPLVDGSGAAALATLVERAGKRGARVILSGLRPQPEAVLRQMGLIATGGPVLVAPDYAAALALAAGLEADSGGPGV